MADKTGKAGAWPPPAGKYMSTVRIGPKGQIVIPKEARELLGVGPGDTLLLLADRDRGVALQRLDACDDFFQQIFRYQQTAAGTDEAEVKLTTDQ